MTCPIDETLKNVILDALAEKYDYVSMRLVEYPMNPGFSDEDLINLDRAFDLIWTLCP